MVEIFMVGTFWFWALIAVEIILLFIFVENDNGIGASISLAAFLALLQFCGNANIFGLIFENPFGFVGLLVAYALLGGLWGIVKWRFYCSDRLEKYEDLKVEFLRSRNVPESVKVVPEGLRNDWQSKLNQNKEDGESLAEKPLVRKHKAFIIRTMSFWVISLIWSMVSGMVTRVFKTIYRRMAAFLQSIADKIWSGSTIKEDLEVRRPE